MLHYLLLPDTPATLVLMCLYNNNSPYWVAHTPLQIFVTIILQGKNYTLGTLRFPLVFLAYFFEKLRTFQH